MLTLNGLKIVPLVSYGRSGSTVFMKALKALGCVVYGGAPFEDRSCQMSFLSHIASLHGLRCIVDPDISVQDIVAKMPYYNSHLVSSPHQSISEIYPHFVAYANTLCMGGQGLIAEKFIGVDLLQVITGLVPRDQLRPIFLQRDPRDVFLSVKEFNYKRGFRSFNDDGDDTQLFRVICAFSRQMEAISYDIGGCLVYYEDLIGDPEALIRTLAAFIGVGLNEQLLITTLASILPKTDIDIAHMTSPDLGSTVMKWKTKAKPEYLKIFENHYDKLAPLSRYA